MQMAAEIAVIGGSGFYSLIENAREVEHKTKYGMPSDTITIGEIKGHEIAFLPRHGINHTISPSKVPYRANVAALSELGVTRIIGANAVGSLNRDFKPGELVLIDQFVNMTHGRDDTFYDEDVVAHVSTAYPYCNQLRTVAADSARSHKLKYHEKGTIVVVNGPRFSTKAESRMFSMQGFDTIGMTQYPEVTLAREKNICYMGIGMVTDYDVGLEGTDIKPVSADEVGRIFADNIDKTRKLVLDIIENMPKERTCNCAHAMDGAIYTKLH